MSTVIEYSSSRVCPCPVQGDSILVMCETYTKEGRPHPTNKRHSCNKVMER